MKYKTRELSGAMLDASVAKASGLNYAIHAGKVWGDGFGITIVNQTPACWAGAAYYEPSTCWAQGGPLIEREQIILNPGSEKGEWEAGVIFDYGHEGPESNHWIRGPTPLIAAMRSYVSSKLGDEVEL